MCGRYYVDDETAEEIRKLLRQIDENHGYQSIMAVDKMAAGDIYPTGKAPILSGKNGLICCEWQSWGFPKQWETDLSQKNKVIYNARSESAMEKPLFRDSILYRRIAIPATGFYEWNSRKEKNTFRRMDAPVLFMAGCSRRYEDGDHFVILTTVANSSMEQVHDRMPLILEREEIMDWILDDKKVDQILHKMPCLLERKTDYEQMSLFICEST